MAATAVKRSEERMNHGLDIALDLDRRRPVADQVYDALKQAIVTTRLLPGLPLSENRLCRTLRVSRTPIRTAITRLVEEGLIDVYPQQGSFVAPIRLGGISDSHFVRRSLEAALMGEAAKVWTPAMSLAVRSIIDSQDAAIAGDDADLFHEEDERFHQAFSVFAGREGVWSTILVARAPLRRFMRLFGRPERLPEVIVEHRAIVDALDAGRPKEAVERLEYHLDRIFILLEQLPDQYRPYVAD